MAILGDALKLAKRRGAGKRKGLRAVGVINDWDLPELMPGAFARASPVQREHFESRCKEVWREEEKRAKMEESEWRSSRQEEEDKDRRREKRMDSEVAYLSEMFPDLDFALVRAIYMEAAGQDSSVDAALPQLLQLSSSSNSGRDVISEATRSGGDRETQKITHRGGVDTGQEEEQGRGGVATPTSSPSFSTQESPNSSRDAAALEISKEADEVGAAWPTLCGADGWQVVSMKQLECLDKEEQSSVWRDRAFAAKELPQQKKQESWPNAKQKLNVSAAKEGVDAKTLAGGNRTTVTTTSPEEEEAEEGEVFEDLFEMRMSQGMRRASRFARRPKYRGSGNPSGFFEKDVDGSSLCSSSAPTEDAALDNFPVVQQVEDECEAGRERPVHVPKEDNSEVAV